MRIILYMAMTLNGYIAREDDETPWSDAVWSSYYKTAKKFKVMILGRRTYEIMKEAGEFKKIGNPFVVVVTSRKIGGDEKFAFVKTPEDAVSLLKRKGLEKVLLGGGGKLNASFMKSGLVDEIYLDVEPVVFGTGIRLFSDGDFEAKLELIEIRKISKSCIQLHYKVKK